MVTNKEVLTVSYGTFSCTLEGFDDSFDTMKAIAEYFRDLAADDRYFGAEPPTPDAEMLARIAEREIERRVQARTEHGAIVLSAGANDTPADPASEAQITPQDEDEADIVAAVAEEIEIEDVVIPEDQAEEEITPEALDIIEDVAVEAEAIEVIAEDEPEEIDVTDAILDAVTAPAEAEIEEESLDIVDAEEDTSVEVEAEVEAVAEVEAEVEAVIAEEVTIEDAEVAVDEDSDVLASMMSRVEAEEGIVEDVVETEAVFIEEDAEDSMIAGIMDAETSIVPLDDIAEDDHELESVAEAIEEVGDPQEPAVDENSIAAKLQRIRAVVSKSADQPEDEDFSEDEHAENLVDDIEEESPSVLTLDDQMAAAAVAQDARVAEEDVTSELMDDAAETEYTQDDSVKPVRARVIRMKRADFESAVDTGLLEAVPVEEGDDDFEDDAEHVAETTSSLSAEEEAELLAELAQVEAELNGAEAEDDPVEAIGAEFEDDLEDDIEDERPARGHHLTDVSTRDEPDMSRLMDEAQNQLNEPGGSRRRQAIAHLRAAVAATKAEKSAGVEKEEHDEAEIYRDDLASVVRPVQPADNARDAGRSQEERPRDPSPLKLVAEQRVDTPADTPKEAAASADETPRVPVRPRRVSAAETAEHEAREPKADNAVLEASDASNFSEFAETVGAHQLHEILEAAAAYLTFVEGHDVFSRPMVMRMVTGMEEQDFSREDSLRGFGQLLRENKIEKVSGGRFTASEAIGFKPEDRAAG